MDASSSTLTNGASNSSVQRAGNQEQANISIPPGNQFSWRITRQHGSTIAFASFDPETASGSSSGDVAGAQAFRKLSLNEELCRPKRIVVETVPDGRSTWRFVPNARREDGVESEGLWPRVVDVDGTFTTLTEDQWDKFKLDRRFDCLVRAPPNLTVISHCEAFQGSISEPPSESKSPSRFGSLESLNDRVKRQLSDDSHEPLAPSGGLDSNKKRRVRFRPYPSLETSDSSDQDEDYKDEDEVTLMIIDDQGRPKRHLRSERLKKVRARLEEARQKHREYLERMKTRQDFVMLEDEHEIPELNEPQSDTIDAVNGSPSKRKVRFRISDTHNDIASESESEIEARFATYAKQRGAKRIRTVSPDAARRAVEAKRSRRENKRRKELDRRAWNRIHVDEETIMRQLYEEGAQLHAEAASPSSSSTATASSPDYESENEEARRQAMIEESRRKIAELEKDRPLWEEAAQQRATQEAQERAQAEAKRRAQQARNDTEEQQRAAARRAEAEKGENARRERERVAAELLAKRTAAHQAARSEARKWAASSRLWTHTTALERYMRLSEAFDGMNFAGGQDVVVFETVPWPVLMRPGAFAVEDIDWNAVESFFCQVRWLVTKSEYAVLVEKSHKRFHPDRWRSRRVLHSVEDEEEKECLEVAANTVAQALTPLWQQVKTR